ncbi:hypothetical protein [Streptomyces colonosanans]|uniref:hypothetical protein n=1 Tax=Streptomyces colonosanans TaxID=1428652 RepID=UPI0015A5AC50|nr:hypothetical protein [Streptomyces colonosanans]
MPSLQGTPSTSSTCFLGTWRCLSAYDVSSPPRPGEHHDPKLVAAAFGMDPQATLIYLADRVDENRMAGGEERGIHRH